MIDGDSTSTGGNGKIIYGGRIAEEDSLPALAKAYPNHPGPKFRFWVIFNNSPSGA